MRILKFYKDNEKSQRLFEYIYEGFIIGGSLVQQKGLTVLRREISLMDKFESISEEFPCGKKLIRDEPKRRLNTDGTISLNDKEFDLVYSYGSTVPWSTGKGTRYAVEALDWLHNPVDILGSKNEVITTKTEDNN